MMNNYTETDIGKERALELLKNCLDWFADDCCECVEMLSRFELLGMNDGEIEALGYKYLLDAREEV